MIRKYFNRFLKITFALMIWSAGSIASAQAIEIQEVTSKQGIKALLVEDYTLPIVAFSFAFEGGSLQDPVGKEGTAGLMRSLLDEGAGEYDSAQFQARLEELGVEMGFSVSTDRFQGGLRTLSSEKESAFEMLRLAINEPRFDKDAMERMHDAFRTSLIRSETSPGARGSEARRVALFAEHPYAKPGRGTLESIETITREDVSAMRELLFSHANLSVGIVGAISAEEASEAIDRIFGELPETTSLATIEDVEPNLGKNIEVDMAVPNASISLVYKGLKRDHPDFFAAFLMNHVLGGGSFTSRLYTEVREKRGLAYGISSSVFTAEHTGYLIAGTSTRIENREEVLGLMKETIADIAENGITQEELDKAKRFVAGSYAINNLDTSTKIARVLVGLQTQNLGVDYITDRQRQIAVVTLEDVNRIAKELLSVEPTVVVVGPSS